MAGQSHPPIFCICNVTRSVYQRVFSYNSVADALAELALLKARFPAEGLLHLARNMYRRACRYGCGCSRLSRGSHGRDRLRVS